MAPLPPFPTAPPRGLQEDALTLRRRYQTAQALGLPLPDPNDPTSDYNNPYAPDPQYGGNV